MRGNPNMGNKGTVRIGLKIGYWTQWGMQQLHVIGYDITNGLQSYGYKAVTNFFSA
jgi:hypothetical protein